MELIPTILDREFLVIKAKEHKLDYYGQSNQWILNKLNAIYEDKGVCFAVEERRNLVTHEQEALFELEKRLGIVRLCEERKTVVTDEALNLLTNELCDIKGTNWYEKPTFSREIATGQAMHVFQSMNHDERMCLSVPSLETLYDLGAQLEEKLMRKIAKKEEKGQIVNYFEIRKLKGKDDRNRRPKLPLDLQLALLDIVRDCFYDAVNFGKSAYILKGEIIAKVKRALCQETKITSKGDSHD